MVVKLTIDMAAPMSIDLTQNNRIGTDLCKRV